MSNCCEDVHLSPEERTQARAYWDALMFATSSVERDHPSLALMKASPQVQQAVMSSINVLWIQNYEPQRTENPFLAVQAFES